MKSVVFVTKEISIQQALKLKRIELGMKQTELAEKMGWSAMGLSHAERGTRDLKISTLDKWAGLLGLKIKIEITAPTPELKEGKI